MPIIIQRLSIWLTSSPPRHGPAPGTEADRGEVVEKVIIVAAAAAIAIAAMAAIAAAVDIKIGGLEL